MTEYNLVITDVTRYGSLFCVAGWDLKNGGMIRPEPPTTNVRVEATRFWDEQYAGPGKFFAAGNIVSFQASEPPAHSPYPHATEDRLFVVGNGAVLGHMPDAQLALTVAPGVSASMCEAFGGQLQRAHSGKAYVTAGLRVPSLDAIELEPEAISFYEDITAAGKRRLRALVDQDGVEYDMSVPADAARTRFFSDGIAALRADVKASQHIHVRLGLCRPFPDMPNSCYAQINGLYLL